MNLYRERLGEGGSLRPPVHQGLVPLWAAAVIPGAVLFLRFGWLPEVLRLKGMGFSNRDIGEDLGISSSTVSLYLKRDPQ